MFSLRFMCLFLETAAILGTNAFTEVKTMEKLQFYPQIQAKIKHFMKQQPPNSMKPQRGPLGDVGSIDCYVSRTYDGDGYTQTCDNWATLCVTFRMNSDDYSHSNVLYGCAEESMCNKLNLFCDQLTDVDEDLCTVDCCEMNGCNSPSEDKRKIFQPKIASDFFVVKVSGFLHQMRPPKQNKLSDGLSCYVTQQHGINPEACAAGMTQCSTVSLDVAFSSGKEHEVFYDCSTDYACENASAYCANLQKQLSDQFTISNCTLACCASDNCNVPPNRLAFPGLTTRP